MIHPYYINVKFWFRYYTIVSCKMETVGETVICTYVVLGFFLTELIFCFIQERRKKRKQNRRKENKVEKKEEENHQNSTEEAECLQTIALSRIKKIIIA